MKDPELVFYVWDEDEEGLPYYSAFVRENVLTEHCVYMRPPSQSWVSKHTHFSDTETTFATDEFCVVVDMWFSESECTEEQWDAMEIHEQCFLNSVGNQVEDDGWMSIPPELNEYFQARIMSGDDDE